MCTECTAVDMKCTGNSAQPGHHKRNWRAEFLQALAETCCVKAACEAVGIGRSTAYNAKQSDDDFAGEWGEAVEAGIETLELEARRRAKDGVDKPVYQGGVLVGEIRQYSDVLLMFLLKAHKPEKYRDNVHLSGGLDHRHAIETSEEKQQEAIRAFDDMEGDED